MRFDSDPFFLSVASAHRWTGKVRPSAAGIGQRLTFKNLIVCDDSEWPASLHRSNRGFRATFDSAGNAGIPQRGIEIESRNTGCWKIDPGPQCCPIEEDAGFGN